MKRIARSAIVEHGAGQIYALVEDIEAYPRFLPWCKATRVTRSGAGTRATLTVGLGALERSFTTENENRLGEAIAMRLVEGPFRQFHATWGFKRLSDTACCIEFTMEYEFSNRALGKLLQPLFDRIADTMVDAFSRRADEVYGPDKG